MHELLRMQLLDLPASGWQWHGDVSRLLMEDASRGRIEALHGLCQDVHWDVDLQHRGACYYLEGHWRVRVARHCSRCNAVFESDMQGLTRRDFRVATDDVSVEAGDVLAPPGELDMLDVLREDIWLDWPAVVQCRADCKGLCQHCGKDLNQGPCKCPADEGDHPFAVLRALKL